MHKLHIEVLTPSTLVLLQKLSGEDFLKKFYLVGGTALALQIGHRLSVDLDFFTHSEFSSNIVHELHEKYEVIGIHNNSVELMIDGVKVFFFYFAFPLYKPLLTVEGVKMVDPIDIGLMKLLALQGRVTRKDIIDLYFIDKEIIKLEELLEIFESYYPKESFNSYDSLKTILDKNSLDLQPMPRMLQDCKWEDCLSLVDKKITKFVSKMIL